MRRSEASKDETLDSGGSAAVAHLGAALALIDGAQDAVGGEHAAAFTATRTALRALADEIIVEVIARALTAAQDEEREPTDDELANRHGVEGGIGYRTEPSMEDLLREKGDL